MRRSVRNKKNATNDARTEGRASKKQKVVNEERQASIANNMGTTYFKLVYTLSAQDSVAVAGVVSANADLSDETHQIFLTPGNIRPCAVGLTGASAMVRELGREVLPLLRYGCSVSSVRQEFFACERHKVKDAPCWKTVEFADVATRKQKGAPSICAVVVVRKPVVRDTGLGELVSARKQKLFRGRRLLAENEPVVNVLFLDLTRLTINLRSSTCVYPACPSTTPP